MDFKVGNYVPIHLTAVGIGLFAGGIFYLTENIIVGIVMIAIGLLLSTTQYRLQISMANKYYREYVWILGIKWGKKITFDKVDYWYITKSKTSQEYGPVYWRIHTDGHTYNGYLKFDDMDKIFVGDSAMKNRLINKITKVNAKLKLEIKDYS
jgi:hypothetical protein